MEWRGVAVSMIGRPWVCGMAGCCSVHDRKAVGVWSGGVLLCP